MVPVRGEPSGGQQRSLIEHAFGLPPEHKIYGGTTKYVLREAMPESDIRVTNVGQVAVINGTVASPEGTSRLSLTRGVWYVVSTMLA